MSLKKKRAYLITCEIYPWVIGKKNVHTSIGMDPGDIVNQPNVQFWTYATSDVEAVKQVRKQAKIDSGVPKNVRVKVIIQTLKVWWTLESWEKGGGRHPKVSDLRRQEGKPPTQVELLLKETRERKRKRKS